MDSFIPDGYTFLKSLTAGFYGPTTLIKKVGSDNQYILKCFVKSAIGNEEDVSNFIRIIKTTRRIKEKCFLPYHHIFEQETKIYCVRPFYEGLNLTSYVANLDINDNLIVAQWKVLVRLYRHLHKCKIYPVFIKPNNIFLDNSKIAFITDIYPPPRHFNPTIHRPTPFDVGFMAPEFLAGCQCVPLKDQAPRIDYEPSPSSDVWPLGVLLWFMSTKMLPWNINNVVVMLKEIQNGRPEGVNMLNPYLSSIILSAMQLDPSKRATTDDLIHATPALPEPVNVGPKPPLPVLTKLDSADSSRSSNLSNSNDELVSKSSSGRDESGRGVAKIGTDSRQAAGRVSTLRNAGDAVIGGCRYPDIGLTGALPIRKRQANAFKQPSVSEELLVKNVLPGQSTSLGSKAVQHSIIGTRKKAKSISRFNQIPK